jgi:glycosyltransferase involved in cell wall biosynthesis
MPPITPRKTLLIVSQVYVPDSAAVGQYLADVAARMVHRGYRVVVLTADRGYEDPSVRYPRREVIDGVQVRRLPFSSFGKGSLLTRLIGGTLFIVQAVARGLFTRRLSCLLVSTSPPLCPIAALIIGLLRRVPIKYWVMDLNPDQVVALGHMPANAVPVRLFNALNRMILGRATDLIVLDRFMADRLMRKRDVRSKLTVLPPWPLERHLEAIPHAQNPFRAEHHLDGKFVIMFSGNMSIASPLTTVLKATRRLRDQRDLLFMFIGGGLGKQGVDDLIRRENPPNVVSLPYQPLSRIKYSLSAADVHLVSMGDAIVGICHPCKVYGAMAVARPILLLGPHPCHISDILERHHIGWHIRHGDVDGAVATIRQIVRTPPAELLAMGERARRAIDTEFSGSKLCDRFCDVLEAAIDDSPLANSN